jgi:hypothetical protein
MSTPGFTTTHRFELESLVFKIVKVGFPSPTLRISARGVGPIDLAITEMGSADIIGLMVQGSDLHVGKVNPNGCSFRDIPLNANVAGTFSVLRTGGGIGISDLRDGRTDLVHVRLDHAPVMVYCEEQMGLLYIHLLCLDRTNYRSDYCVDTMVV